MYTSTPWTYCWKQWNVPSISIGSQGVHYVPSYIADPGSNPGQCTSRPGAVFSHLLINRALLALLLCIHPAVCTGCWQLCHLFLDITRPWSPLRSTNSKERKGHACHGEAAEGNAARHRACHRHDLRAQLRGRRDYHDWRLVGPRHLLPAGFLCLVQRLR